MKRKSVEQTVNGIGLRSRQSFGIGRSPIETTTESCVSTDRILRAFAGPTRGSGSAGQCTGETVRQQWHGDAPTDFVQDTASCLFCTVNGGTEYRELRDESTVNGGTKYRELRDEIEAMYREPRDKTGKKSVI